MTNPIIHLASSRERPAFDLDDLARYMALTPEEQRVEDAYRRIHAEALARRSPPLRPRGRFLFGGEVG